MCDCAAQPPPVPFEIRPTGAHVGMLKQPEFEVKNTTDRPVKWGSAAVYYYDAEGRQLEAELGGRRLRASRANGANFYLAPGETKKLALGFKKDAEPSGHASIEVVVDGWCFGTREDRASELCITLGRSPDDRPRSGPPR
jgi:hypothetical protein